MFLVSVTDTERQSIEKLDNWREKLEVGDIFVRTAAAGRNGFALAKHADGRCVFLNSDNLCLIHKLYGLQAKPLACQLYPFVVTPVGGCYRVGLRFDCPAVCDNSGADLTTYTDEIKRLTKRLAGTNPQNTAVVPFSGKLLMEPEQCNSINEEFLQILSSNAIPLFIRLHWLYRFCTSLRQVKWKRLSLSDSGFMLNLLRVDALRELQDYQPRRQAVVGRLRRLLGQVFFILAHPAVIITVDKKAFLNRLSERFHDLQNMRHLGCTRGALPAIRRHWPDCDAGELEVSFGHFPTEADRLITRYLVCRVAGFNYCGKGFYQYTMLEGIQTLILAVVCIGWMMRIEALAGKRHHLVLDDAKNAILHLDGNLGYAPALGTGMHRWRLDYISKHLEQLIDWYCT